MPNDLIHESSPYLLQHADNPVDWLPWSDKALKKAKREDRPILLSIGYAACHWCHVMAHESFEDEEIAAKMNRLFVCVKVDREERPDLDRIYQAAHQILTQRSGGWPLTVALSPSNQAPYFAGTYFPPSTRQGMPGFNTLLDKISQHYLDNRAAMDGHGDLFSRALSRLNPRPARVSSIRPRAWLAASTQVLKSQFDAVNGGFGDAPRFPHPTQLELLLRHSVTDLTEHDVSLAMLNKTMRKMQQGGIFDQIGGGFYRYSVDKAWRIPHFEKMLYDNAQLLGLYAECYARTGHDFYRTTSLRTARWVIDEMQQGHGGYASSLDADTEGDEGKFYVWSETDLRAILTTAQYEAVENHFSLYGEPNFEGKWHLNVNPDLDPDQTGNGDEDLATATAILRDIRSERVRPNLDDKIVTSWNGLMIRNMVCAGIRLSTPDLVESARAALDFIRAALWNNGRLWATFREQRATLNGYLDDYVFLADALLTLLQYQWRNQDYLMLEQLCESILEWFEDAEQGGFYFTSHDHETLLHRPKPGADEAIPAANGIVIRVLSQFSMLSGDSKYRQAARRTVELFSGEITKHPAVYGALVCGALDTESTARLVIVRGKAANLMAWQEVLTLQYLPGTTIFWVPANEHNLPPGIADKPAKTGKTLAYVCHGSRCLEPVEQIEQLQEMLQLDHKPPG